MPTEFANLLLATAASMWAILRLITATSMWAASRVIRMSVVAHRILLPLHLLLLLLQLLMSAVLTWHTSSCTRCSQHR
jgi:hypothetical protein